ncbi:MAG: hypothetical protein M1821_006126 [Bathelium mastoideum]|nr:MAG: hypothetical protein M1821_006126 [Bathelium mastoideum]
MRTSLKRNDGSTTLFMPASSSDGIGVKIVTLASPNTPRPPPDPNPLSTLDRLSLSSHPETASTNSSSPVSTPAPSSLDLPPPSVASAQTTSPRGSLTLLDRSGSPRALINAEELTAFRTALASVMLFKKRHTVHDVLVFGAGRQAYWHVRLALLLRGDDVHHVCIVNRDFARASALVRKLFNPFEDEAEGPAPPAAVVQLPHRAKFAVLTPSHHEYERLLKEQVRKAAVIFLTTPSVAPLFPAEWLTSTEGRRKGRYIAAIGSYKPHMLELHPDVLKQAVAPQHDHRHFHKHARTGGAVLVDSVEACLKEAGEVIQAGLKPEEVVELGELVMLKRDNERRRAEAGETGKGKNGMEIQGDGGLIEWLSKGNVIYKSVGLGLMDVITGGDVVRIADERGVGTRVEGF